MKRRVLRSFLWIMSLCLLLSVAVYGATQERPAEPSATSGSNGDSITWSYNTYSKTLTISGSAELGNYEYAWTDYASEIKTVNINNGVTAIFGKVFENHTSLETVNLPASMQVVYREAFLNCPALAKFTVSLISWTICSGVQKMCASSCVKPRTRKRPCRTPSFS